MVPEPPETLDDVRSVGERAPAPIRVRDRYEVGALLGEGGMGEVLECRDAVLERRVALKTVRRDRRRQELETRFLREACVQAQLEHPGVVPVYDVSRDDAGSAFFTMRRVSGVTLAQVIDEKRAGDETRRFTRHRLLTAFAQICQTVDYAHARGVLHRDLKPANVSFGAFGEVYVLDWGLAKVGAEAPDGGGADAVPVVTPVDGMRTAAGATMGTPAYMAPEQMAGEELDVRADVFALGAMLFEILTLETLFDDDTIRSRLEGKSICVRATAAEREKRFSSVHALHDAVEAYLGGARDTELRASLAASLLERAREARRTDSAEALRLTNRALALAPGDPEGLELLVELSKEPPRETAQVRDDVARQALRRMRAEQPTGAFVLAIPWLTVYPAMLLIRGVRDSIWMALVIPIAWLVAGAAMFIDYRRGSQERVPYVTYTTMAGLETLVDTEIDSTPVASTGDAATIVVAEAGGTTDPLVVAGARYATSAGSCRDRIIGREIAMRVLPPDHVGRADLEDAFVKEALVQARLDHPGIPPVYDLGRDERGTWFTMKRVQGTSLAEVLDAGDATPRHRLLATFAQVCLAIDFAHSRGVLHGALDPANVMLGAFGEVYVVDWGLARTAEPGVALAFDADVSALGTILREILGRDVPPDLEAICAKATARAPEDRFASTRALHEAVEAVLARDRDEALRNRLAAAHLAKASKSAEEALAGAGEHAPEARVDALRELGRAIAVATDRAAAQAVLSKLLASPPRSVPREVAEQVERQGWDTGRASGVLTAKLFVIVWLGVFPLTAWVLGVRDLLTTSALVVAWVLVAIVQYVQCALMRDAPRHNWAGVISMLAASATSVILGPFLLMPIVAVGLTLSYVLAGRRAWQRTTIALAAAAVVVPSLLCVLGVFDVFHFAMTQPDTTVVITGCLHHTPARLTFGLLVAELSTIFIVAGFAGRFRDQLDALEAVNRARVAQLARILG